MSGDIVPRLLQIKSALAFTSYHSGFLHMLGGSPQGQAQLHQSGNYVDRFRIDGDIGELYDVEIVEGFNCPMTVSPIRPMRLP